MVDDQPASVAERRFAENLRAARETRGMTQSGLAAAMAELGHRWYAQTVGKIEIGNRAVRLGEAQDVAKILGTTVEALSEPPAATEALLTAAFNVRKTWQRNAEALLELRARIAEAKRLNDPSFDDAITFAEEQLRLVEERDRGSR